MNEDVRQRAPQLAPRLVAERFAMFIYQKNPPISQRAPGMDTNHLLKVDAASTLRKKHSTPCIDSVASVSQVKKIARLSETV